MAKAKIIPGENGNSPIVVFFCPGCRNNHAIPFVPQRPHTPKHWFFDGNLEAPTIEPSLRVFGDGNSTACHIVITAGRINYQPDDPHFPGQVSGMLELEKDE